MKQAPISIWIFTLVCTGIAILILSSDTLTDFLYSKQIQSKSILQLQRLLPTSSKKTKIVAIGTSKTRRALPYDEKFVSNYLQLNGSVDFVRITLSGASFETLQPALSALSGYSPDLVLIESDLLLFDRTGSENAFFKSELLKRMRKNIRGIRYFLIPPAMADFENVGNETWQSPVECGLSWRKNQLADYKKIAQHWKIAGYQQQSAFLHFLKELKQRGAHIILLGVPRSPTANQLIPKELDIAASKTLQTLIKTNGFATLSPDVPADDHYCDLGHMNQLGRDYYSRWLSHELSGLLKN